MGSIPDLSLSPRSDSSDSYYSSMEIISLCEVCRTRLWTIENEYAELMRNVGSCPYCYSHEIGMSDTSSNSNDEEDSDSTEYRNAILGIDSNMSDSSSFSSFGSDIMHLSSGIDGQIPEFISEPDIQEPPNYEADIQEPPNHEPDIQQSLIYETNDHQVEEDQNDDHEFEESSFTSDHSDIPRYPERSTRSDIDSYYETPLRNRFWTWTKSRSSSRSRRGI